MFLLQLNLCGELIDFFFCNDFCYFQITELKAENYEAEKEARLKIQNVQKQNEETINNLQVIEERSFMCEFGCFVFDMHDSI